MPWLAASLLLASLAVVAPANVRQTGSACEELADALVDVVQHLDLPWWAAFTRQDLFQWATSLDLDNREQMVATVCGITEATPAGAATYMESSGLLEHLTKRVYDMGIVILQTFRPMLQAMGSMGGPEGPPGPPNGGPHPLALLLELVNTLEEMGFLGLDPQGVQESSGYITSLILGGTQEGHPRKRRSTSGCARLRTIAQQVSSMAAGLHAPPGHPTVAELIQQITGINIMDQEALGSLLCDVADSSSISEIVSALRSRNIYVNLLSFASTQIYMNVPPALEQMTWVFNLSDEELQSMMWVPEENIAMVRERNGRMLRMLVALQAVYHIPSITEGNAPW